MRRLLTLVLVLCALAPSLVFAQGLGVINPSGHNSWDLYSYGNGRIIFYVLTAIKMLMVPDVGNTMFNTLLLLMGSIGFLALAVAAGFDPGKNLMRMFTYIIVIWGVSYGSTKVVVNVTIVDKFAPPTEQPGAVSGVPALVALPAVFISQVGEYFTNVMETYFTVPGVSDAFKTGSKSGVPGQFNLFAKMMAASNEYVITNPELKKSLSAYMTDCVVPAIAMGRLVGPGKDGDVMGSNALLRTTDMMATLASAKHQSIMTKYFPMQGVADTWQEKVTDGSLAGLDPRAVGFGAVVTCDIGYEILLMNLTKNARNLLDEGNAAWAKAGVLTPFEAVMGDMLAQTAAPGSVSGGYGSPAGAILQQTVINSSTGAFRNAAILSGNNELLQSAALSQAELSQKSAWVAGFEVFNNMMGYVYTVLQAFIFAVTPIMVIALMIPGLGKKIFMNYLEILIWLSLWMPMLALVNFIITLFGTESLQTIVGAEGGLSANNKVLITEKTKDLILASQFLGTMVPLLTWGLVKGALAFTEFINHGIGSTFASQAGASAASGNMSMNNMSMNNTSMNKYDTSMSSAVGTQAVTTHTSAGSNLVKGDMAGGSMAQSGAGVDSKKALQDSISKTKQEAQAWGDLVNTAKTQGWSLSKLAENADSKKIGSQGMIQLANMIQESDAFAKQHGVENSLSKAEQKVLSDQKTANEALSKSFTAGSSAALTVGTPSVLPVSVKTEAKISSDRNQTKSNQAVLGAGSNTTAGESEAHKKALTEGKQVNNSNTGTQSNSKSTDESNSKSFKEAKGVQEQAIMGRAISRNTSFTTTLAKMESMVNSAGVNNDVDIKQLQNIHAALKQAETSLYTEKGFVGVEQGAAQLEKEYNQNKTQIEQRENQIRQDIDKGAKGINPNRSAPNIEGFRNDVEDRKQVMKTEMGAATQSVENNVNKVKEDHKDINAAIDPTGPNAIVTQEILSHREVKTRKNPKDGIPKDTPQATKDEFFSGPPKITPGK